MDESEPTEPRVSVQHCLLIRQGIKDQSWSPASATDYHPFELRGVGFRHRIDPQATFPNTVKAPWAVYLRITGRDVGPTRVLFRVHYESGDRWEHLDRYEMDRAVSFPDSGEHTRDVVFNLPHLRFGGFGMHALSMHFWYDGVELDPNADLRSDDEVAWAAEPEELFGTSDWSFGTVEYFLVEVSS